eukprot:m.58012 g.58012  ORF g.58012 m.58012 type:complete len:86 (-) comp13113_c0_seq1:475-732(-)
MRAKIQERIVEVVHLSIQRTSSHNIMALHTVVDCVLCRPDRPSVGKMRAPSFLFFSLSPTHTQQQYHDVISLLITSAQPTSVCFL